MEESIKSPDGALEAWECFDNIICTAPAGIRSVEIAVIDLTAVGSALPLDFVQISELFGDVSPPRPTSVLLSLPAPKLR